jgi:hypothetical protein
MASVVSYSLGGRATEVIAGDSASVGPLAAADYTGDDSLDLFVGGRVYPGAYPLSPSSRLYLSTGARLRLDGANSTLLRGIGMVPAALFSDIDGDGDPDLLLAIEWGTIRIFLNDRGRFRAAGFPGLAGRYSRWNGLATGDLDGDGRLDIVATSWGKNLDYQVSEDRPLFLYFPGLLLAQQDDRLNAVAPLTTFQRLAAALPGTAQRLGTFRAFADASIEEVLGSAANNAIRLGATTMEHTVFFNRGDHFEPRALPPEAQFAPAFSAGVADFNGDGNEDIFLSQNFFNTEITTPRHDAGRGLLLLGDGTGHLEAAGGQRSGITIYGEQRGAAYADYDGDGRLDLAVSQNGAPTRLFHNIGAEPGLRVRLVGPASNPMAIGAQLRLVYGSIRGPVREVQAGSGYWSQNGAIQILGKRGEPTSLWIRWPGGREHVVPVAPDQRYITVEMR